MTTEIAFPEQYEVFTHERPFIGGIQIVVRCANNYGASIVRGYGTYGEAEGLWELGVIRFFGPDIMDWRLNYDTEITNDVIGHLTESDCIEIVRRIAAL